MRYGDYRAGKFWTDIEVTFDETQHLGRIQSVTMPAVLDTASPRTFVVAKCLESTAGRRLVIEVSTPQNNCARFSFTYCLETVDRIGGQGAQKKERLGVFAALRIKGFNTSATKSVEVYFMEREAFDYAIIGNDVLLRHNSICFSKAGYRPGCRWNWKLGV